MEKDVHVNTIGIALSVGCRPTSLKSPPDSETEQGLSPHPWTQQSNISQSSMKSSDFESRQSHISSNRSSVENPHPRSGTPINNSIVPTTFATIEHSPLEENSTTLNSNNDDELPTEVIMPAVRAEQQPRSSSRSSNLSAASSGKGSNIGAWLRKKRGLSVSSGGGSSVVSD